MARRSGLPARIAWERRYGRYPAQPEREQPEHDSTSGLKDILSQGVPVVVAALIAAFIAVQTNNQSQKATAQSLKATNVQLQISQQGQTTAEQGQFTDRYNAAITNLGSHSIEVRLGGIYALQRLMQDSHT